MSKSTDQTTPFRRTAKVFISYSKQDELAAAKIRSALEESGATVWPEFTRLSKADEITGHIEDELDKCDFVIMVLSRDYLKSKTDKTEMRLALRREAVDKTVSCIPVRMDKVKLPTALDDRFNIDCTKDLKLGIERLKAHIRLAPTIDLLRMPAASFERMVVELLSTLSFRIAVSSPGRDFGVDFVATYVAKDPLAGHMDETWLVRLNAYRENRVSVATLREFLGILIAADRPVKGLMVTNSFLTSVARSFLEDISTNEDAQLRVIDGEELLQLLSKNPKIATKYLGEPGGQ